MNARPVKGVLLAVQSCEDLFFSVSLGAQQRGKEEGENEAVARVAHEGNTDAAEDYAAIEGVAHNGKEIRVDDVVVRARNDERRQVFL